MDDQIETEADLAQEGETARATAKRWITEIKLFEAKREKFEERAKKIIKRYRDEREASDSGKRRLNILWANTETLKPTVYAQTPKASVSRRNKDRDHVGRVASTILERAISTMNDLSDDFDETMIACRDDFLLIGMGASWCRYVPTFKTPDPIAVYPLEQPEGEFMVDSIMTGYQDDEGNMYDEAKPDEEGNYFHQPDDTVEDEVIDEYLDWRDFGHNSGARTWNEVYAVWRKAYMTRNELTERFGEEIAAKLELDNKPEGLEKDSEQQNLFSKATVYEIWCKSSKKVYWINTGYSDGPLDERADPLKLSGFFPCPKPMFGTLTNDSLTPVPDYVQYQDQAEEIDDLTARIDKLTDAIRLRGLYAGEIDEIKRLLTDTGDTELIPVENWAMFAERGGIANAVVWLPIAEVAQALLGLYEARDRAKQDLYEVTGLSDIIRGASDAAETATAQAIKAQWGSVRVRDKQKVAARFARDQIRIKAEIVAEHFHPETILRLASAMSMPESDHQYFGAALKLIRDDKARGFAIDIESDSTVAADEQADKEARIEFLTALTGFVQAWGPIIAQAPEMLPLAQEALLFAVRGFKVGEALETAIEQTMEALKARAQQAQQPQQPPQPDPTEVVKAKAAETKAQAEVVKAQTGLQAANMEAQMMPLKLQAEVAKSMGANGMGVM